MELKAQEANEHFDSERYYLVSEIEKLKETLRSYEEEVKERERQLERALHDHKSQM